MPTIRDNIADQWPFISVLTYGENEYVGIIINQDQFVTSFYDLELVKTGEARAGILELGEIWWWESNRQIPINIFLRKEIEPYRYCIKTFNSKDVTVIMGPVVNLMNLTIKRIKRKNVQLVRKLS